jgi:hypothetical protein
MLSHMPTLLALLPVKDSSDCLLIREEEKENGTTAAGQTSNSVSVKLSLTH